MFGLTFDLTYCPKQGWVRDDLQNEELKSFLLQQHPSTGLDDTS